jgi:hypothetical protein
VESVAGRQESVAGRQESVAGRQEIGDYFIYSPHTPHPTPHFPLPTPHTLSPRKTFSADPDYARGLLSG